MTCLARHALQLVDRPLKFYAKRPSMAKNSDERSSWANIHKVNI